MAFIYEYYMSGYGQMDEGLRNAAIQGDVAFLQKAVASNPPIEYFKLQHFPRYPDLDKPGGNLFHLAAAYGRAEFYKVALEALPFSLVHFLLCQENHGKKTPLDEDFISEELFSLIEEFYKKRSPMDAQLKNAAIRGDVKFLEEAVASNKPIDFKAIYFPCPQISGKRKQVETGGSIFHIAAAHGRDEFFRAAINMLPLSESEVATLLWRRGDRCALFDELIKEIYAGRNTMEEQLKEAAIKGDVEFLKQAVASNKPSQYFETMSWDYPEGNILHLAARKKKGEFLRIAMEMLPEAGVDVCRLLSQPDHSVLKWNPLHDAAFGGYNKLVKLILEYCAKSTSAQSNDSVKPWLTRDKYECTPFHFILSECREDVVLELLSMDPELFAHMDDIPDDDADKSPFVTALRRGFSQVIVKFSESSPSWHTFNQKVLVRALPFAPYCTDEIFILVLKQNLEVIKDTNFYHIWPPLNQWALIGKSFPFEYVLEDETNAPHLRRCFIDMMAEDNLLYYVLKSDCDEAKRVQIGKIIVDAYEKEREKSKARNVVVEAPWFAKSGHWQKFSIGPMDTVLHVAIGNRREKFALHFLSLPKIESLLGERRDLLFLAIEHECGDIALKILDLVDKYGLKALLISSSGRSVLHDAPRCKGDFLRQLVKRHPELIEQHDDDDVTILHSWMEIAELWPFECILNKEEFRFEIRKSFAKLLSNITYDKERTPLHVAVDNNAKGVATERIVQFLFSAIREQELYDYSYTVSLFGDNEGNLPIDIALSAGREELALCYLSLLPTDILITDGGFMRYRLFKAIDKELHSVVKFLLDQIHLHPPRSDELHMGSQNILHVASKCTGMKAEENLEFVLEKWPHLINERDENNKTPLERAAEAGASWLVKLILEKDPSSILKAPLAWVEPCKKGDMSTVLAFIEQSPYMKDLCRVNLDTPFHHIQGVHYRDYKALLDHEFIKELKNLQNSTGETPLHVAINSKNKELAEILLRMDDVDRTIKNNGRKTPMDLLKDLYEQNEEWEQICKLIGVDPTIRTTYIHVKSDLSPMRDIISLVAALLATITFTAGFTLPGGLDNNTGEAMFVKKAAFLVFLITDAYAMCCSMLVLFCIIWSMVCKRDMAALLIDRSLVLLKQSLYGTLLAFMTGVYLVIHRKSLWAAIAIFIMCSLVIIIANRSILHIVLPKLIPAADNDYIQWQRCWKRIKQKIVVSTNQNEASETEPLNKQQELVGIRTES